MSIAYERWDGARARADADRIWRVYDPVFADRESELVWRAESFDRHTEREGFDLVAAVDGDDVIGFSYGYIGRRGQYWSDRVAGALDEEAAERWVGGHFEFVELAVLDSHRRLGVGRRLHDLLLEPCTTPRALLSTDAAQTPAVALYRSRGWTTLGLLTPGTQVMGLMVSERP